MNHPQLLAGLLVATMVAVALLFWWSWWNDRELAKVLRRLADNDRDITSLARAVSRLENPVQHALSDHLSAKKPLTVKKPRRKSPPRR